MANNIYPKYKQACQGGGVNTDLDAGTVKIALLNLSVYTYSDTHEFFSDLSGVVGTPALLANTTVVNGVLDGDDVQWNFLTGPTVGAIAIFIDTSVPTTSRLYCYIDTGIGGFPFTPDGTNLKLKWNPLGIVKL
jgi:hypothetical protein